MISEETKSWYLSMKHDFVEYYRRRLHLAFLECCVVAVVVAAAVVVQWKKKINHDAWTWNMTLWSDTKVETPLSSAGKCIHGMTMFLHFLLKVPLFKLALNCSKAMRADAFWVWHPISSALGNLLKALWMVIFSNYLQSLQVIEINHITLNFTVI